MLIDHIATTFTVTYPEPMHFIGRLTMPIMSFFIAEGYSKTSDVKKYATRLFLFGLVSQIPYTLLFFSNPFFPFFNIMFSLFLGLICLWALDKEKNPFLRSAVVFICFLISPFFDWNFLGLFFILIFGYYNQSKKDIHSKIITFAMFSANALFYLYLSVPSGEPFISNFSPLGVFLSLPLLLLYNGKRGGNNFTKWLFYLFYPTHLIILYVILSF